MSEKEDSPTRNGSTDREVRLLVLGQDGVGKTGKREKILIFMRSYKQKHNSEII